MTEVREPGSIIEMAEMVRRSMGMVAGMDVDHDVKVSARELVELLTHADFYELGKDIEAATDDLFREMFHGKRADEIRLDADCRLPSPTCAFWGPGTKIDFGTEHGPLPSMYVAGEDGEGNIVVSVVSPYTTPMLMGYYALGHDGALYVNTAESEDTQAMRSAQVLTVAAICSVINQPGFLKREPVGTRQERRAAQRSGGYAHDAWHRITWNIGEQVQNRLSREEPLRCMPLHYTRGHWRKAREGWRNAERRKDDHWYQWIEGYWSGHPAFGVKRSVHAPKMAGVQ